PQAFSGFGDPAVVLIASLYVVSEGLDASGVTTWVGQRLVQLAGSGRGRLLLFTTLLSAELTAFIGLNGTVAAQLPIVIVMSLRQAIPPSRFLMPLAFAGSAGQLLLLTGSPVNIIISQAAADAGVGAFAYAEFALVGIPLVVGTIAIVMALSARLVPDRRSEQIPPDLSDLAGNLVQTYSLDNVAHLRVGSASDLVNRPRSGWDLIAYPGVRIITVVDAVSGQATSAGRIEAGDRLTMVGDAAAARQFADDHGLTVEDVRSASDIEGALLNDASGAAEAVIPPRSVLVGSVVEPSQVIEGSLIVLGISRGGKDLGPGPTHLRPGDTLLVEGPWEALEAADRSHDLLVVDSPELIRRQNVSLGSGSKRAMAIMAAMVILLVSGIIPASVAALLAAIAMILTKVVNITQAYRGINWTTVFLLGSMFPMAIAVTESGAGDLVAGGIVELVGDAGPIALLTALFLITVVFSQLISNTATALVMIPIAVSAANQVDISARPVLMSLCVGAAVAFLTPVATPPNLMVIGPAGYRFGDYWRLGLPLVLLFGVVAIFLVPAIWQF
ncbi:MAG: hypothetical protein QG597_765, partial [Actinomycetota bacterium]|nr:hypothetical protein [Actinomycetota bacterium]